MGRAASGLGRLAMGVLMFMASYTRLLMHATAGCLERKKEIVNAQLCGTLETVVVQVNNVNLFARALGKHHIQCGFEGCKTRGPLDGLVGFDDTEALIFRVAPT
jgi:hypothetical protein